jgi:hypothetical protein
MYALIRDRDRVRQARWTDFEVIDTWRALHFAEMGRRRRAAGAQALEVIGQANYSTAAWAVYVDEEDFPLAAIGFRDVPEERVRNVTDLYAERSKAGLRAGEMLGLRDTRLDRSGEHGLSEPLTSTRLRNRGGGVSPEAVWEVRITLRGRIKRRRRR